MAAGSFFFFFFSHRRYLKACSPRIELRAAEEFQAEWTVTWEESKFGFSRGSEHLYSPESTFLPRQPWIDAQGSFMCHYSHKIQLNCKIFSCVAFSKKKHANTQNMRHFNLNRHYSVPLMEVRGDDSSFKHSAVSGGDCKHLVETQISSAVCNVKAAASNPVTPFKINNLCLSTKFYSHAACKSLTSCD